MNSEARVFYVGHDVTADALDEAIGELTKAMGTPAALGLNPNYKHLASAISLPVYFSPSMLATEVWGFSAPPASGERVSEKPEAPSENLAQMGRVSMVGRVEILPIH